MAIHSTITTQKTFRAMRPTWYGPLLMMFVRWPLLMFGYSLFALLFSGQGLDHIWERAATHNYVIVSLFADLGCLLLLTHLARREHTTLLAYFQIQRKYIGRDILLGLALFFVMALTFYIAPMISGFIVTGRFAANWGTSTIPIPFWVHLFNICIFPITTSIVEELVYRGYALPHVERLTGRAWLAVLIPASAFALAHLTPPFISPNIILMRFLTLFIVGIVLELLYLRFRRLLPLVIGHYFIDLIFLALLPFLLHH